MPGIKQVDVLIIVAAQEVTAIVRVYQACDVGSPDLTAGRELEEEGRRRRSGRVGGKEGKKGKKDEEKEKEEERKGVEIWEDRGSKRRGFRKGRRRVNEGERAG